jgi:23S rRNA (cytosine1962-C5)-methyltransferase
MKINYKNELINSSKDYSLLDFGDGEKLERFGKYIVVRPDPQALAKKSNVESWKKAVLLSGL